MIPSGERKCRDVLCCGMFALFWVGMIVIAGIAFDNGNPSRLLYGTDYQGNVCGTGDYKDMKYITYPRTTEDFLINVGKSPDEMKVRKPTPPHPRVLKVSRRPLRSGRPRMAVCIRF
jgi:solute carrier family 44 (choline transporter-like protein), member 2/4/5